MEGGAPGGIAPLGGHQFGGYESYGFDDDNFGSGALYPGGGMGMRSKKADMERECEFRSVEDQAEACAKANVVTRVFRQPFRWYAIGRPSRRDLVAVQGPARLSILAKEARGGGSRAQGYDLQGDLRPFPRAHDR